LQTIPPQNRIVLVGGGHSHCIFLKMWAMKKVKPPLDIILINPSGFTPYTGMLPGLISGNYTRKDAYVDLVKLCNASGVRLLIGSVGKINLHKKSVMVQGRAEITFDIISVNVGIKSMASDFLHQSESVVSAKPMDKLYKRWKEFLAKKYKNRKKAVTIVGGGLGGLELAFAVKESLEKEAVLHEITVIERGKILKYETDNLNKKLTKFLLAKKIKIIENINILRFNNNKILLSDGTNIHSDFTIMTAGAHPYTWIEKSGIPCNEGFIVVDSYLKSSKFPFLYAAGDCAHLDSSPRPKAGVFAVRAGPYLFHNIISVFENRAPRKFFPQRNHLKLISIGGQKAISSGRGFQFSGNTIWRWKNFIDKKFMEGFSSLKPMGNKKELDINSREIQKQMICGGCGSKIGQELLNEAISKISKKKNRNILNSIGDDAAIINNGLSKQIVTTDHLKAFTKDPWLLSRISIIHSLGDIWAMGSKPKFALLNIILPEASKSIQANWLHEIMDAANYTFLSEDISLIGGHTTQGAELTIGVTLLGDMRSKPTEISNAKIGDKIVLTKPIGTGVILAGEMQGLTSGQDLINALSWMQKSQSPLLEVTRNCNAMTDVTGFGLIGHLMNICEASSVSASISINKVPLLDGAIELVKKGVKSTLFSENKGKNKNIHMVEDPALDLLFDPQTSGGMLISIPSKKVKDLQIHLTKSGLLSSVIGEIRQGIPSIFIDK